MRSGHPFSPTIGYDRSNLQPSGADQGQRPNYSAVLPSKIMLREVNRWFDSTAFSLPEAGFLGNVGRNVMEGPGIFATDLAVRKTLWSSDVHTVSFRAEAYNLTNHPNLTPPNNNDLALFDSRGNRLETAGRIVATSTTSRQIQLSLRWAF
jgi:hypothetical protein